MSATINKCQLSYQEMLDTYSIAGIHETVRYSNVIYMICNRHDWNKEALVAFWSVRIKHFFKVSNTMQQTHPMFGELAHYGSEPFIIYMYQKWMAHASKSV